VLRPQAQVADQPGRLTATRRLGPGPHAMTTKRSRHLATYPASPTNGRSSGASGLSWSATRSSWPLPNHLPRRQPSQADGSTDPSTACASLDGQVPTRADDEPVVDTAGDTPTPALPVMRLPAPPPLRPHSGRTQRTRERTDTGRHTGRRTPDTWTLRRPHRTGHRSRGQARVDSWTLAPDTERRTGPGQGDEGTASIRTSWATTPSAVLGHPTVFLWTALRRLVP
jgi:hypothetical protein